ncbi:MAG: LapA family protein [Halioglobus sp.]|nr:LapA family protein [Halioglobus sp.]
MSVSDLDGAMKLLRKLLTIFIILAVLLVSVLFALQNTIRVPLDLLVYSFEPQSLALWVLVAFALGGIIGMLISSLVLVRTRALLRSARRQLEKGPVEANSPRREAASRSVL